MWYPRLASAAVALLLLIHGAELSATDSPHSKKAKTLAAEGRHLDAAKEYEAAWKETGIAAYLFHAARALEAAGAAAAAVRFYKTYLVEDPEAVNRAEVEAKISVLAPTAPASGSRAAPTGTDSVAPHAVPPMTPAVGPVLVRLRSAKIMPAKADGRVWDGMGRANPTVVDAMAGLAAGTVTAGWAIIGGLVAKGLLLATEMPDPFAKVYVNGTLTDASRVVRDTITPIWDGSHEFLVGDPAADSIDISVWDKDVSLDDPIGTCSPARGIPSEALTTGTWIIRCRNQVYEIELSVRGAPATPGPRKDAPDAADDASGDVRPRPRPGAPPDATSGASGPVRPRHDEAPAPDVTVLPTASRCICEKGRRIIVACAVSNDSGTAAHVTIAAAAKTKLWGVLSRGEVDAVVPPGTSVVSVETSYSGLADCGGCTDGACSLRGASAE